MTRADDESSGILSDSSELAGPAQDRDPNAETQDEISDFSSRLEHEAKASHSSHEGRAADRYDTETYRALESDDSDESDESDDSDDSDDSAAEMKNEREPLIEVDGHASASFVEPVPIEPPRLDPATLRPFVTPSLKPLSLDLSSKPEKVALTAKPARLRLDLRKQLHMIIAVTFLVTVLPAGFACRQLVRVFFRDYVLREKGRTVAWTLASPVTRCIVDQRQQELESYLATVTADHPGSDERFVLDLGYARVFDRNGRLIAPTARPEMPLSDADSLVHAALDLEKSELLSELTEAEPSGALELALPLRSGGKLVGVLRLHIRFDDATDFTWHTTISLLFALGSFLAVIWVALYLTLRHRILGPVLQLSAALQRIRDGDLTTRLHIARYDELGALAESLNTLVERLKEQKLLQVQLNQARSLVSSHEALAHAHSELAQAYERLKEVQDQLVKNEKHASLGRLVRGVAHEINNPLNTVKNSLNPLRSALESLFKRLSSEESSANLDVDTMEDLRDIRASCAIIERGVGRAVAIVRDLRSFSSLGIQELQPLPVGQIIDQAVEACEAELGPENRVRVDIKIEAPGETGLIMEGHRNLLVQLFVNLISNAAQAIVGEGRITIDAKGYYDPVRQAERIRVHVEDDGPGIPEEVQNKIFEPFFTTKEAGKGSGLGLALCLGIVEKHNGEIKVTSEPGKGTIFTIDLAASQSQLREGASRSMERRT